MKRYQGPNTDLVNEVIDFAFSDRLLSQRGPDEERDDVLLTTDMVRAVDAAGAVGDETWFKENEESDLANYGFDHPDREEAWWCWHDLLEMMAGTEASPDEDWRMVHKADLELIEDLPPRWYLSEPGPLYNHLTRLLPAGPPGKAGTPAYYRDYIINQVGSDITCCAKHRAYNGKVDNFWEWLLGWYMQGVWPCGWKGVWPYPGKLIAWRQRAD